MNLSPQRMAVLVGIANGKSNQQMAEAMGVGVSTVKTHLTAMYGDLGVTDRGKAIGVALRLGILLPEQVVMEGECPGVRVLPNWCQCSCDHCKRHRCDLHGSLTARVRLLGDHPAYLCFVGRHSSCDGTKCTCGCGHSTEEGS